MSAPQPTITVILSSERTGSNLLVGLIDSQPGAQVGGELFNQTCVADNEIPFPGLQHDGELLALRQRDPGAFLQRLAERAAEQGATAVVGYKVFYRHLDQWPAAREHLLANRDARVIHLRRRQPVHQVVSYRRAVDTGEWQRAKDAPRTGPAPRVEITIDQLAADLVQLEAWVEKYDAAFSGHRKITLWYEDIASDPAAASLDVCRFLDLPPVAGQVRYKKTGTTAMRDSVANFDALCADLRRWIDDCG